MILDLILIICEDFVLSNLNKIICIRYNLNFEIKCRNDETLVQKEN